MNTLTQAINATLEARRVKDETKEQWVSLMSTGSVDQGIAKQSFLAADGEFSLRAGELGKMMTELRDIFCLEIALEALPAEQRSDLRKVIAELRFDHLLAPFKASGLLAIATAWRNASAMLDAARSIDEHRRYTEGELDLEVVRKAADTYRNPEALRKALTVCELLSAQMHRNEEHHEDHVGEAARATVSHLLKSYDRLTEQLQSVLEDLHYAGALSTELSELDPELRRYVQDALGSGLVRERQRQTETKRKQQSVTTIDAEAEEQSELDRPDADRFRY